MSCYSLFPLLYEVQEYPIKVLLLLLHSILMWHSFSAQTTKDPAAKMAVSAKREKRSSSPGALDATVEKERILIGWIGKCYLFGLLGIEIWGQFLHPYLLGDKLPFVPLLLVSLYCAFGMIYSWVWQLRCIMISTWFLIPKRDVYKVPDNASSAFLYNSGWLSDCVLQCGLIKKN